MVKKWFLFFALAVSFFCSPLSSQEGFLRQPCVVMPWIYDTHFWVHDDREVNVGQAEGLNLLYGVDCYLTQGFCVGGYGVYQATRSKGPVSTTTVIPGLPPQSSRGIADVHGNGGGFYLSYLLPFGLDLYIDSSWVRFEQRLRTEDLTGFTADIISYASGHNWEIDGGLLLYFPFRCLSLSGYINYVYIKNHLGRFSDFLQDKVAETNSSLGIGNIYGACYLFPCSWIHPFVSTGLSYDFTRHVKFPTFFSSTTLETTEVIFPLRSRFEWNVGGGLVITRGIFSFALFYQHKERSGPITTDLLSFYSNMVF